MTLRNIILGLLAGSVFMLCVFATLNNNGQYINCHSKDMTDSTHTFKMYESFTNSIFGIDPIKSCTLPILANGNYPNNPSAKVFGEWLNNVKYTHSWFTLEKFISTTK